MKHNINTEISLTYIVTKKKLTAVAALGITIGLAIFIFMNSMLKGFDRVSEESIFKTVPHIRIYKDDETAKSLLKDGIIINPKIVPQRKTILNPILVMNTLRKQKDVKVVSAEVNASVFFNSGKSQINGLATGVVPDDENLMFNVESFMVEGHLNNLKTVPNGIVLGVGVAKKMNVRMGDNISITSSRSVQKVMKVVGLFQTNNTAIDKYKSYINISAAQQLLKEGITFITDINVNIENHKIAKDYTQAFSELTGYKAEDWETANEQIMAAFRMRRIIITVISFSILVVAGFGIYNILNMTISQKINDIAILKAMGFKGGDVIRIFVRQAMIIGFIGVTTGLMLAAILINILAHVYIGGDIGYFPIQFEPSVFVRGIAFGFIITFLAGYLPARKAADVDPVSIFRK
jgi:lipoprotein-releasing system permease protein